MPWRRDKSLGVGIMEAGVRLVLLLVGVFIIAGIVWDTWRAKRKAKMNRSKPKVQTVRMEERLSIAQANAKASIASDPKKNAKEDKKTNQKIEIDEHGEIRIQDGFDDILSDHDSLSNDALSEVALSDDTLSFFSEPDIEDIEDQEKDRGGLNKPTQHVKPTLHDKLNQKAEPKKAEPKNTSEGNMPVFAKPVILHLMSKDNFFPGNKLLDAFLDLHLYYGDQLFHHHENSDGTGEIIFSVVSAVEPGIFDISKMEKLQTPGISLFFMPTRPNQAIAAFEMMLRVARRLAERLNGELWDENRRPLSLQSIDKYRERVRVEN